MTFLLPENQNSEYHWIDIEIFPEEIPYDRYNVNEEQIFFCLGHWDKRDEEEYKLLIKSIVPIQNVAEDKINHYEVNPLDYERYKDLLVAVVHTHPSHPLVPSDADVEHLPKDLIGGIYEPITNHLIWWNGYRFVI